jgi:hypothetical protein
LPRPPPEVRLTCDTLDLYKGHSIERRTGIGPQDILVNGATAQGNGPHRFYGRFDFGVSRHGTPLKRTNSTLPPERF